MRTRRHGRCVSGELYTIVSAKLKVFCRVEEESSEGRETKPRNASRLNFFCDRMCKWSLCLLKVAIFLSDKLA